MKIRAQWSPYKQCVEFFIYTDDGFAESIIMTDKKRFEPIDSCFTIRDEDKGLLQELADDLWRIGLRPTESEGHASTLQAKEAHLQDMRKLALKLKD